MASAFSVHHNPHAVVRGDYPFADILSLAAVEAARREISRCPIYARTPLRSLAGVARRAGVGSVYYKDEAGRFGLGSFKALGGAYAVGRHLLARLAERGVEADFARLAAGDFAQALAAEHVVCASDGNHGRAVAAGARRFGCRCTVFLHEGVSPAREQAIRALGADVVRTEGDYDRSVLIASEQAARNRWQVISDTTDDPEDRGPSVIMQGYGTLVAEAVEQIGAGGAAAPTHVFLQGGVGGLAASVTAYLWELMGPQFAPVFVVVEPVAADCLFQSARQDRPVSASGDLETLMAGLSCGEVSRAAWPILDLGAEFFMTIGDDAAIEAMRLLARGALGDAPIVAGESGVAGLAGLLAVAADPDASELLRLEPDSSVLLIGSEGATDPEIFARLVEGDGPLTP